ncbi:MAG: M61 family metallopeptidase [Janthinobacterium lividum]
MKNTFLLILLLSANLCFAQKEIFYTVSFPNAIHHEAEISMQINDIPAGALTVRMSRSSPGRYATHEFGKNIYSVKAADLSGKPLTINQIAGDVYQVPQHGSTVKISYTLYGNWVDGTYAGIDISHAHLNIPATFIWVEGMDARPIKVQFNDLEKYGWKQASQLKSEGKNLYSAPNLQYFMDSPVELSAYKTTGWDVINKDGKKEHINYVTHADDEQPVVDAYGKMIQKLVEEEKAVFGEWPVYDYGSYTFLQDVYPGNAGDGMEHRNSTIIVERNKQIAGNEVDLLSTFSHEYFHSWNVERIRPKSLEPFNFEHANMSSELWFAEGFTQYYGEMLLVRAGFRKVNEYTNVLTGLVNQALNTPGAAHYSPAQASRYAVFADAGVAIDPTNKANIFTSYYTYGGATALALDLRLRSEFKLTLDDFMRAVWLKQGKTEIAYTIPDLQNVLAKLTGNAVFADTFFKQYIYGFEKNDYKTLLANAGLILQKAQPGNGWMGNLNLVSRNDQQVIFSNTIMNTPVYKAGLDMGDILLKADGQTITGSKMLTDLASGKKPGDQIKIDYQNRSGAHQTVITLEENPLLEVVTFESANQTLTPQQEAFRKSWLSSKIN